MTVMDTLAAWVKARWVALDKWLNWRALRGNRGETISSRCGRQLKDGDPTPACRCTCRGLDVFWPSHCLHNIQPEFEKP